MILHKQEKRNMFFFATTSGKKMKKDYKKMKKKKMWNKKPNIPYQPEDIVNNILHNKSSKTKAGRLKFRIHIKNKFCPVKKDLNSEEETKVLNCNCELTNVRKTMIRYSFPKIFLGWSWLSSSQTKLQGAPCVQP
jgi:hypothetical protein